MTTPIHFKSGASFLRSQAAIGVVSGVSLDEAIEVAVRRATEGGCTCNLIVHVGNNGIELCHDDGCPRLSGLRGKEEHR